MEKEVVCLSYITGAVAITTIAILSDIAIRFCCRGTVPPEERNSRLAMLLMLLLADRPNHKYIRMAKQIGYDHIVNDDSLFERVPEYASEDE